MGRKRWTWILGGVAVVVVAGGALLGTAAEGSHGGEVTLTVVGALNVSAYCGGEETHFAEGTSLTFVPEKADCDVEAPLSPTMPLRGRVHLDQAGAWRCDRRDMSVVCAHRR